MGTGGALYECFDWLDEDFLILYADVYSKVDLRKLISFHHENRNDMTCVTHPNDHPFDSDILETDNNNKIIKVHPHPRLDTTWLPNNINAAMYCANKKIFNCRIQKRKFDIAQHLLPSLIDNDFKVGGYKTVEYLKDMGTPNRLNKVKLDVKRNIDLRRAHSSQKKAIYIDRDGTINKEAGHISELDQFALEAEAALAIKKINSSHYLAFCVTNQPVIARGEASENKILNIHNKMETLLGLEEAYLDEIVYCPHHPDGGFKGEIKELKKNCDCRKPKPGLINELSRKYNIDNSKSFMIGDRFSDVLAGERAGSYTVLITSGSRDKQETYATRPFLVVSNLNSAVQFILESFEKVNLFSGKILASLENDVKILFIEGSSEEMRFATVSVLLKCINNSLAWRTLQGDNKKDFGNSLDKDVSIIQKILEGTQKHFSESIYIKKLDKCFYFQKVKIASNTLVILDGTNKDFYFSRKELKKFKKQSFFLSIDEK